MALPGSGYSSHTGHQIIVEIRKRVTVVRPWEVGITDRFVTCTGIRVGRCNREKEITICCRHGIMAKQQRKTSA